MAPSSTHADRARKLLALAASSTFEEEARTAAVQAARLIATHGLSVAPAGLPRGGADDRTVLRLREELALVKSMLASAERELARVRTRDAVAPTGRDGASRAATGKMPPRLIIANHAGWCRVCRGPFCTGDRIWWIKRGEVSRCAHEGCWKP